MRTLNHLILWRNLLMCTERKLALPNKAKENNVNTLASSHKRRILTL